MDSYLSVIGLLQMLVAKIIKQLIDLLTPSTLVPTKYFVTSFSQSVMW